MNNRIYPDSLLHRTIRWITQHAVEPTKNFVWGRRTSTSSTETNLLVYSNIVNCQSESRKYALNFIRNRGRGNTEGERRSKILDKLKKMSQHWGKKFQISEKPLELICPICMDFLVGGVSTKCGHTFCWQCLDQAVLLNPGCPVCRTQIRGDEFTLCLELEAIVRRYVKQCTSEKLGESELHFNTRSDQFEQWLSLRLLAPSKMSPSDLVDVRDTENIWCSGLIRQILKIQGKEMLHIHYIGWNSIFDEILSIDSQRLATYRLYSSRKNIPHYDLAPGNEGQLEGYVLEQPQQLDSNEHELSEEQSEEEVEFIDFEIVSESEDEEECEPSSAKMLHRFCNPEE